MIVEPVAPTKANTTPKSLTMSPINNDKPKKQPYTTQISTNCT